MAAAARKKKLIIDTDPGIGNLYAGLIFQSAAEFLVEQASGSLGPPYKYCIGCSVGSKFTKNVGEIVILGGTFSVNGNVNPAAEANIFGEPDAADIVFTSGANILAVGINVTHQVVLTDVDRDMLAKAKGKYSEYLCKIFEVYFSYHHEAYSTKGVYLYDPTAPLAAVHPSLITYTEGAVRVQTNGITRGLTLFYNKQKRFAEVTAWSDKPSVKVAVTVIGNGSTNVFINGIDYSLIGDHI